MAHLLYIVGKETDYIEQWVNSFFFNIHLHTLFHHMHACQCNGCAHLYNNFAFTLIKMSHNYDRLV